MTTLTASRTTAARDAAALRVRALEDLLSVAAWAVPDLLAVVVRADRRPCVSQDPDLFFPVGTTGPDAEKIARARLACEDCPVRAACLALAMSETPAPRDADEDALVDLYGGDGIWGGTTAAERRDLVGTWRALCGFAAPTEAAA